MHLKKLLALPLAAACLVGMMGCAAKSAANDLTKDIKKTEQAVCLDESAQDQTIEAMTGFGVALLQNAIESSNPLISSLSIDAALSMTANGAVGETKAQMETVLGADTEALCAYFSALQNSLNDDKQLKLANSIWLKDTPTLHVEEAFLQKNADAFGAGIFSAPFDASTVKSINSWVSQNTDKMIPEMLSEIQQDTVMYLINALAFDAKWESVFETSDVWDGTFTARGGAQQTGSFLHGVEYRYLSDTNAEGFLKTYAGGKYAFAALLPEEGTSLEDYTAALTGERLHAILTSPKEEAVEMSMPKFKTDFTVELSDSLKSLGMPDAFDSLLADFSSLGTSDEGNLYISSVLHKTFIQVDEAGTKAGAATAVAMKTESAAMYPHSVFLTRPFLYMIVDLETGLPIFLGALTALPEV